MEKRAPVPRHIGLRPIGEHLLFFAPAVLAGPHRLLDWVHPGWGRLLCQIFVSQFCFHFRVELKEQQHPSNNICCLSKMIDLCLLKLSFDENSTRTNCTTFISPVVNRPVPWTWQKFLIRRIRVAENRALRGVAVLVLPLPPEQGDDDDVDSDDDHDDDRLPDHTH